MDKNTDLAAAVALLLQHGFSITNEKKKYCLYYSHFSKAYELLNFNLDNSRLVGPGEKFTDVSEGVTKFLRRCKGVSQEIFDEEDEKKRKDKDDGDPIFALI